MTINISTHYNTHKKNINQNHFIYKVKKAFYLLTNQEERLYEVGFSEGFLYAAELIQRQPILDSNNKNKIATTLFYIANAEIKLKNYDVAYDYAQQSLNVALSINYREYLDDIYKILAESAAKSGDFAKAYDYQFLYQLTKDSLINIDKNREIARLETKFNLGEKDLENKNEDKIFAVSEIKKYGVKFWDGIKIYLGTKKIDFDYYELSDLVRSIKNNKNLSARNIFVGKKVLKYILSNKISVDEIKSLSRLIRATKSTRSTISTSPTMSTKAKRWTRSTCPTRYIT